MLLTKEEIKDAIKHISHNEMTAFNIAQAIEAKLLPKLQDQEPVAHCFNNDGGFEIGFLGDPNALPENKEILLYRIPEVEK